MIEINFPRALIVIVITFIVVSLLLFTQKVTGSLPVAIMAIGGSKPPPSFFLYSWTDRFVYFLLPRKKERSVDKLLRVQLMRLFLHISCKN